MNLGGLGCRWFLFDDKILLFVAQPILCLIFSEDGSQPAAQCFLFLLLYCTENLCVSCFTKIPVCASQHNVLNSSNTRTKLASQRLPSPLLVLLFTLATIPSTISEEFFTLVDKEENNCQNNQETIKDISKKMQNVEACKDLCKGNSECVAVTYFKDKHCSVHSRLCTKGKQGNNRDVFRRTCKVTFWEDKKDDCSVSFGVVTNADTCQYLTVAHVNLHLGYFDVGKIGNI